MKTMMWAALVIAMLGAVSFAHDTWIAANAPVVGARPAAGAPRHQRHELPEVRVRAGPRARGARRLADRQPARRDRIVRKEESTMVARSRPLVEGVAVVYGSNSSPSKSSLMRTKSRTTSTRSVQPSRCGRRGRVAATRYHVPRDLYQAREDVRPHRRRAGRPQLPRAGGSRHRVPARPRSRRRCRRATRSRSRS